MVVSKEEDPVCLVIDKPADQCWTVCECKCSWVANYQLMQNMTPEEFKAFQQERSATVQEQLSVRFALCAFTGFSMNQITDSRST